MTVSILRSTAKVAASKSFKSFQKSLLQFYLQNKAVLENAEYQKEWWQKYWKDLNVDDYKSELLRRQLRSVKQLGDGVLKPERLEYVSFTTTIKTIPKIYIFH